MYEPVRVIVTWLCPTVLVTFHSSDIQPVKQPFRHKAAETERQHCRKEAVTQADSVCCESPGLQLDAMAVFMMQI